ncbi:MAG: Hsp20/alpha crystallin family protein [Vulcanimicrobiota bacterium]
MPNSTDPFVPCNRSRAPLAWEPHISMIEDPEGHLLVEVLLPGAEHVETQVEPNYIRVRGRRSKTVVTRHLPREFEHHHYFPRPIDPASAKVEFLDGILSLRAQRSEHAST